MKKLHTVRLSYLYIFGGSLLLSGVFLFAVQRMFHIIYSRYTPESEALFVRCTHWIINHIGKTPIVLFLFMAGSAGLFWMRSQKTAEDMKALLLAGEALAVKGSFEKLSVISGGELGQLAGHLRTVNRNRQGQTWNTRAVSAGVLEAHQLDSEEVMTLILRTKALVRLLAEAEAAAEEETGGASLQLEMATREAMGMERFLENLNGRS
ncbi:hypothetical protein GCM10010912_52180 [Paenibacillus albidus]|uniref:Uncharacterized protein n=1 Tax=Paenibacillus albidus TaxID=2041023 RepID=A0A917CWP9_9BACL|nr:hypothetical protein [Paenibacillus albidus]GGG00892.1 hypothetical protein GCM10010912_52180 [Paenibacillus albidus]